MKSSSSSVRLPTTSGTYRWSASHDVAAYTNWARASQYEDGDTDEPNGGTAENCVYKSLSYPPGWSDTSCEASEADTMPCFALCQHGGVHQPTPSTTAGNNNLCTFIM